MAKKTLFSARIRGGSVTISGTVTVTGTVGITFPTSTVAKAQTTNAQVLVGAGADAIVLAANALRTFAIIENRSGADLNLAFGAAASATTLVLPNNGTYTLDISTVNSINRQAVHIFNPTGGGLNVNVYEE